MSVVSVSEPMPGNPFKLFRGRFAALLARILKHSELEEEESRKRRDFVQDMMHAHPEAFQSELDVQNMMHFYPSRF